MIARSRVRAFHQGSTHRSIADAPPPVTETVTGPHAVSGCPLVAQSAAVAHNTVQRESAVMQRWSAGAQVPPWGQPQRPGAHCVSSVHEVPVTVVVVRQTPLRQSPPPEHAPPSTPGPVGNWQTRSTSAVIVFELIEHTLLVKAAQSASRTQLGLQKPKGLAFTV